MAHALMQEVYVYSGMCGFLLIVWGDPCMVQSIFLDGDKSGVPILPNIAFFGTCWECGGKAGKGKAVHKYK